jgi:hypothetical protein
MTAYRCLSRLHSVRVAGDRLTAPAEGGADV